MNPKKVMCFGTFDLLHLGHLDYFRQAKEHGDHLTVVIARDATKEKQKKDILFSEEERLQLVQSLGIVDEAVLGDEQDHFKIIREKKPDVICLGYDHAISEEQLREELRKYNLFPKIIRAAPFQSTRHKSSVLREKLLTI
ncbi:FAD synthase [Candidatus Woesearchaeota archaeon]|nr:FAD synthase [Candidatus Woesearchaeota archaeon]